MTSQNQNKTYFKLALPRYSLPHLPNCGPFFKHQNNIFKSTYHRIKLIYIAWFLLAPLIEGKFVRRPVTNPFVLVWPNKWWCCSPLLQLSKQEPTKTDAVFSLRIETKWRGHKMIDRFYLACINVQSCWEDKGCPFKFEIESYLQGHPSVQILFHSVSTHLHLQESIFSWKREKDWTVSLSLFLFNMSSQSLMKNRVVRNCCCYISII